MKKWKNHLQKYFATSLRCYRKGLKKVKRSPKKFLLVRKSSIVIYHPESSDPLSFWVEKQGSYPLLSQVVVDILTIPASSAMSFLLLVNLPLVKETDYTVQ